MEIFGKHAYLQSAYTKDEEAALKWKEELMAEFPGMEFQQDPLSLSVACHIGAGALRLLGHIRLMINSINLLFISKKCKQNMNFYMKSLCDHSTRVSFVLQYSQFRYNR